MESFERFYDIIRAKSREDKRNTIIMILAVIGFIAAVGVAFLLMLVLFAVGAYLRAKRSVKDSMHNVAEAQDADDFIEEGNLSLSFSGNKKGPRQEQDNWPV